MDVIIDHILHFLQFDLTSLFGAESDCCLCQMNMSKPQLSESMEKHINNVYEPCQQITDGYTNRDFDEEIEQPQICSAAYNENDDADDNDDDCIVDNGRQLVRVKQETESIRHMDCDGMNMDCGGGGDCANDGSDSDEGLNCTCEMVCKQLMARVAEKCSSATFIELQHIEERATKLWETLNSHLQHTCGKLPSWWELKSWQKLPFYWAALSNEILCEDPFDNFKRFYLGNNKPKRGAKRQNEKLLIVWHRLNCRQRLPFVMESFISKVGAGKVNICDEHEIQRCMVELQNK